MTEQTEPTGEWVRAANDQAKVRAAGRAGERHYKGAVEAEETRKGLEGPVHSCPEESYRFDAGLPPFDANATRSAVLQLLEGKDGVRALVHRARSGAPSPLLRSLLEAEAMLDDVLDLIAIMGVGR
ncbi:MAG: hypothetical protein M0R66_06835 [Candidatus Omnitrophica bacterium]|jgi:hypothetical protein|nr:hypothetical protein [Candidatus Omnitrophota bacterium]